MQQSRVSCTAAVHGTYFEPQLPPFFDTSPFEHDAPSFPHELHFLSPHDLSAQADFPEQQEQPRWLDMLHPLEKAMAQPSATGRRNRIVISLMFGGELESKSFHRCEFLEL